jgi:hypothetical protein
MAQLYYIIGISKMIKVNLSTIKTNDARKAINWLLQTYGPCGDRWTLSNGLDYVEFRKDRDASLFLIHWS